MPKKAPKKAKPAAVPKNSTDDLGAALSGIAQKIGGISEELEKVYYIEALADNLGNLAAALDALAGATALAVIARNGTDDERATAVKYLKRRFDVFEE